MTIDILVPPFSCLTVIAPHLTTHLKEERNGMMGIGCMLILPIISLTRLLFKVSLIFERELHVQKRKKTKLLKKNEKILKF